MIVGTVNMSRQCIATSSSDGSFICSCNACAELRLIVQCSTEDLGPCPLHLVQYWKSIWSRFSLLLNFCLKYSFHLPTDRRRTHQLPFHHQYHLGQCSDPRIVAPHSQKGTNTHSTLSSILFSTPPRRSFCRSKPSSIEGHDKGKARLYRVGHSVRPAAQQLQLHQKTYDPTSNRTR